MTNGRTKIPKIIHYCWFGGNEKPEVIQKCIASWREKCPDYEIKEWNELNFDVTINRYMKEAYDNKKWAFVSDYARVWIIYNHGGIYMDTDVEILERFDELLNHELFLFFESEINLNSGQGFGAVKGNPILKAILDDYNDKTFIKKDGKLDLTPSPAINTAIIRKCLPQLERNNKNQTIDDIALLSTGTYGKYMYHYGTASWTDRPNWSTDKRKGEWKDTRLKRFLRKPARVTFVEKHFSKRVYNLYILLSYDFLEYGPMNMVKKHLSKRTKR